MQDFETYDDEDDEPEGHSELDVSVMLLQLLEELSQSHPDDLPGNLGEYCEMLQGSSVGSLRDGGFLTSDEGLSLRFDNGDHFTMSVKMYRRGN